ncbi:hypothetical protein MAUB1S_04213 [Mycolicibacterium aubagnense]
MQAARRVDHDHVGTRCDALVDGVERHGGRIGALGTAHDVGADAGAPALQLVGSGGAEGVGRPEHDAAAVGDQHPGQFADGGGLAGSVDPDHEQHRRFVGVRECPDGPVQVGPQFLDQHLAQHRAGIGLGAHVGLGHPAAQRGDDRFSGDRPQVGDQQGVFDGLPGVLIQVAAAQQTQHAATQRGLRLGQATPQPLQPAGSRRDLVARDDLGFSFGLGFGFGFGCRLGLGLGLGLGFGSGGRLRRRHDVRFRLGHDLRLGHDFRLRKLDIGNGALARVTRNLGVVADGRQLLRGVGTTERDA